MSGKMILKYIILGGVILGSVLLSPYNSMAWEIDFDTYLGGAIYKESESTVDSDWTAFYNKSTVYLGDYDNKTIEGDIRFGMSYTSTGTETWDISGVEYQTNDMKFWEMDTGVDLGWAFPVELDQDTKLAITPLVGYRWRFIRFTRENFTILNTITIRETIDEDYNLHFLDLGGRIAVEWQKNFEFFAKPIFGIVLYNATDNSELGTVKGDGGFSFRLDTGINYAFTENIVAGVSFTMELQRLKGGESGNILWPDNSLDTYGGTIAVKYRF